MAQNSGKETPGAVTVQQPDGTLDCFLPLANTRQARGVALEAALAVLQSQPAAHLPGSIVSLDGQTDYQLTNRQVDGFNGIMLHGNGAVIYNGATDYDLVLEFSNCDELVVDNLTVCGTETNRLAPANGDLGQGLLVSLCNRIRLHNVACNNHHGRGSISSDPDWPVSVASYGLRLRDCFDYTLTDISVNCNGRNGLEINECQNGSVSVTGNDNGRLLVNASNTGRSPGSVVFNEASGRGSSNGWTSPGQVGCNGFSVGSGVFWNDSRLTVKSSRITWSDVNSSQNNFSTFGFNKITDFNDVSLSDCVWVHGTNSGSNEVYSLSISRNLHLTFDKGLTSGRWQAIGSDLPRLDRLEVLRSSVNEQLQEARPFGTFEVSNFVTRESRYAFTTECFSLVTEPGNSREVVNCDFVGGGTDSYIFDPADNLENACGEYIIDHNTKANCAWADTPERRLMLSTNGRNCNELRWDETLTGDDSHPAPAAAPQPFPNTCGRRGMCVVNGNYTSDVTTIWGVPSACYSSTASTYVE